MKNLTCKFLIKILFHFFFCPNLKLNFINETSTQKVRSLGEGLVIFFLHNVFLFNSALFTNLYYVFKMSQKFLENLMEILFHCIFLHTGPIIAILAFAICCRTVRRIILHKGGNAVTIVTYHPIPSMTTFTVPLESVRII